MRFLAVLAVMIILYRVLFHCLMAYERRKESWLTHFCWTLTVMSTLRLGNFTFPDNYAKIQSPRQRQQT